MTIPKEKESVLGIPVTITVNSVNDPVDYKEIYSLIQDKWIKIDSS